MTPPTPRVTANGPARDRVDTGAQVTTVPLLFRRRGHRTLLVAPSPAEAEAAAGARLDPAIVKTLGKAFHWQLLLDEGRYTTVRELALALQIDPGWAAEVLRMTLLAPDMVEAIMEGRQPRHWTLQTLRGRDRTLPRDWDEQRRWLGWESSSAQLPD